MSASGLPSLSPYMCMVLYLFFDGEKPYQIYGNIAEGASDEKDHAFEEEVKMLRDYFKQRSKENV